MYILPSLFTTANIAFGYYAILQITHATVADAWHFDNAAKAIGFAVMFDGLDGRIARMTGTSSDFGRELDSLADVITFGVAPALLAWTWGFRQLPTNLGELYNKLLQFGAIASFLFLMAGASRLARFNISSNPQPSNPGRPGKKYFVGMPIPAGAGVIAAVVHFSSGDPIASWWTALTWMLMVVAVGYLMVSTWRFYSFKDIDFRSRQPFQPGDSVWVAVCGDPLLLEVGAVSDRAALRIFRRVLAFEVDLPAEGKSAASSGLHRGAADFMSSNFKSVPTAHADPVRAANLYRLAIVGAGTLKGKEVAEVLGDRNFPSLDIKLLDDNDSLGKLESVGDEVSFIQSVRSEQFEKIDFTFFASDQECTRQNWKKAQEAGSAIVDLSYALEDEPDADVKSPWIQRQLGQMLTPELQPGPAVVAHPAAVVLALLLLRIQKGGGGETGCGHGFRTGVGTRTERHGRAARANREPAVLSAAAEESIRCPGGVQYGGALRRAVGPVAGCGRAPRAQALSADRRQGRAPASLLMVQAPIFHGYAFSLHVEMEKPVEIDAISKALAGEHVTITGLAEESPSNVNAAGQGDVLVSIQPDTSLANGLWLWASADNLRIAAATAVECAENMAATRPKGKIQ